MKTKTTKLGFITFFTTYSESSDHYVYVIRTNKRPTMKQLDWWLKVNASDVNEDTCFESIHEVESIDLDNLPELTKLHTKDPAPEIDFL